METRERSGSVRDRTHSIEEQMTSSGDGGGGGEGGGTSRSNILSRISKMGQSMLPTGASPTSAISEDDIVSKSSVLESAKMVLRCDEWCELVSRGVKSCQDVLDGL